MRAAVMRGGEIVVDDVPEPAPASGQVLVRTLACGICGSDLHALMHAEKMVELSRQSGAPFVMDLTQDVVMGHEFAAEVLELGPDTESTLRVGDVVVSMPMIVGPAGVQSIGYSNTYPGGYAERMVLSALLALKVPDGLPPRLAALTEPMAVGRHAVNRAEMAPGGAALVLGCGPVGMAVVAALAADGVAPIVAADYSPMRRQLAAGLGAHITVDPAEEPAIEAWRRADGAKVLTIFEAVGVPGMLSDAMGAAPRRTRIIVVGVCMEDDTVQPMIGIAKELEVRFALGYDPSEFAGTLASIAEGTLDVAPLITASVDIDGVPDAFRALANPAASAKILVVPRT
jgi:threonine dehydrogenase-like Zn-dependent dehydrogenase